MKLSELSGERIRSESQRCDCGVTDVLSAGRARRNGLSGPMSKRFELLRMLCSTDGNHLRPLDEVMVAPLRMELAKMTKSA